LQLAHSYPKNTCEAKKKHIQAPEFVPSPVVLVPVVLVPVGPPEAAAPGPAPTEAPSSRGSSLIPKGD